MPVAEPFKIKEIFAQAQYSVTAHKNLQNQLKKLHQSLPEDIFFKTFTNCLKVPLMCGEKTSPTERTLDFATNFITSFIDKKVRPESDSANEDDEVDDMPQFVTDIFTFLCENAGAENQTIRFRICQFINKLLNGLGNDACMDDELCDLLCDRLMERLKDKSAAVRTQAVRALYRLQDPTDVNCRVTLAFCFHLSSDPSADVRATILTNIAVSAHSVRGIVERTRDTNETVRKVAFVRIAELNIQRFTIKQRVVLLERGLKDQSEKVRKCVTNDLLRSWFDFHKGNYVAYLHALDCEHSSEISALSLQLMFKSTKTGLTNAIEQIRALQSSDRLIPVEELNPENVLLWKVVYEYLENHPEIAEERPVDEPLEELVPELSTFCTYVLKYFDQPLSEDEPWMHAQREYILGRLLEMCEGFDLADEMGRTNLRSMCQSLLLNNQVSERVLPVLVNIMVKVIPDVDDRLQFLAEVIAELHDPSSDAEEPVQPPAPEMTAEEKRQLEIKEAKIKMKLNELTEDQDEAVKAKDFLRAQQLLDECEKLKDELKALIAPPPPVAKPATQEVRTEELVCKDKGKIRKCLCIVKEMMQPSSVVSLTPTLRSLMQNFVMPCLQQAGDPVIKNMALEAMGLFCLLDRDLAKQHFVYMFCFQIANDEVCETALKITFDLLHLYGLETFEVKENKTDDAEKKRAKKKKNLFVTDSVDDEFEEDEDDTQSQTLTSSGANTSNLIGMLTSLLGSTSIPMRNLAMKGLCKLLLACRMTSSALLSRLMVMWYSPVTEGDEDFRQPMAAFLKALSTICPRGQEMLEQAFLPTLKTLRDAPADSPLSEVDTESVTKLFISLTRPGINRFHKKQNTHVHNAIAVTLCNEILNQEDNNYSDDGILLRSLLQLELCLEDPVFRQDLQKFIVSMKEVFRIRREKLLYRYVERFEKMVEESGRVGQTAVPEVNNTAQTDQLHSVDNTARTDQLSGADNTTQTDQVDVASASVVKKSRKNARILKRGEVVSDADTDDDNASDISFDVERNQLTHGIIIPESPPRPGSPSEASAVGSQDEIEEAGRQDPKRRKVADKTPKKTPASPEKVARSLKTATELASGSKTTSKRAGRQTFNDKDPKARSPSKKMASEPAEADERRGSRTAAPTAEQVKETDRAGRRAKNGNQYEGNQRADSRRKRKPVEIEAEPTRKKAADSPGSSKKAVDVRKTGKIVKVVLNVMEVSDARPRREIKLTTRALAYKEDLSKRSPRREKSPTSSSPKVMSTPQSLKKKATNADTSSLVNAVKGITSSTDSQSESSQSPTPSKRTRRVEGAVDSLPKDKLKQKALSTKNWKSSRIDVSSSDEMFADTPAPSRSIQLAPTPASVEVSHLSQSSPMKMTSPVTTRKQNTQNMKNQDGAGPRKPTRSGSFSADPSRKSVQSSASQSTPASERASRSKTRPEEAAKASPVTRRVKTVSAQEEKSKRAAKTTKPPATVGSSSSDETSSPERRALRAKIQQSSSSTDSPLPASSSSENSNKPVVKAPARKSFVQPSSSDDSSVPEAGGRATRARRSDVGTQKRTSPLKNPLVSQNSRVSERNDVIQRAVDRVRRSTLSSSSSPSKDSPARRSSRSSSREDILQRAVERVKRLELASPESGTSSSAAVVRKVLPSSSSSDSPARSTRSGSSQEDSGKRTAKAVYSKESPVPSIKKPSSATPQKTPGQSDSPAKPAKTNSGSSSSSKASSKSNEKSKSKSSLGRLSSGSLSSPSMSTRSMDLINKLRTRKRL